MQISELKIQTDRQRFKFTKCPIHFFAFFTSMYSWLNNTCQCLDSNLWSSCGGSDCCVNCTTALLFKLVLYFVNMIWALQNHIFKHAECCSIEFNWLVTYRFKIQLALCLYRWMMVTLYDGCALDLNVHFVGIDDNAWRVLQKSGRMHSKVNLCAGILWWRR